MLPLLATGLDRQLAYMDRVRLPFAKLPWRTYSHAHDRGNYATDTLTRPVGLRGVF